MATLHDTEFGDIILRRSARATAIRIRVAPDGRLRASLPLYTPVFLLKRLINSSRVQLRGMLSESLPDTEYYDGMAIGKSHTLIVRNTAQGSGVSTTRHGQQIIVSLPSNESLRDPETVRAIRDIVITALRVEAKSYLPKRLSYLAQKHNFSYERVRFSHASGRWGSCSSNGTISLNIALMKLPFELIDYVIIHELSHTVQMNHSEAFWQLVSIGDPAYKLHRSALKNMTPTI